MRINPLRLAAAHRLLPLLACLMSACVAPSDARPVCAPEPPVYTGFSHAEPVSIEGYDGDVMEPFISPDQHYLFFNNRNAPHTDTNLLMAEASGNGSFRYLGEIPGVNSAALDAVASMDVQQNLYLISTRSYDKTHATVYRGKFGHGKVTLLERVPHLALDQPGLVTFDAEIAADGKTLFVVDGKFSGAPVPDQAVILMAHTDGTGFERDPASPVLMQNINTSTLNYAPAISSDMNELFFTRLGCDGTPFILRASRAAPDQAFGKPERVGAITGFTEGPSLSADGNVLYYHKLEHGHFRLYRVTRTPSHAT